LAAEAITINTDNVEWSNTLLEATNYTINPGQVLDLLVSDPISNDSGTIYNSVRVTIKYSSLQPNIGSFSIGAILEGKDVNEEWVPLAYQFSPYRYINQAPTRHIILQPDMDTYNLGIDDVVFPVNDELARISRQQGRLPESLFRVRVVLEDSDPSGAGAWVQVAVTASGEMYNV